MVIRKRPRGKARHSRSYLDGGILYTAKKRSAAYNDIIPVSEQKRKPNYPNQFLENVISGISKRLFSKNTADRHRNTADRPTSKRRPAPVRTAATPLFSDRSVVLCTMICIALVVFALIAVPTAFAKSEVSVNLLDSGRTFTAMTTAKTVGEFLEKNNIEIGSQDYLETSADLPIKENMDIIIRRAMPLSINAGNTTEDISMIAGTVSEALDLAGVQVDPDDEVYPALDAYVRPGMSIDYINVDVQVIKDTQTIGYKEIEKEDDSLMKGDSEVVQYGEEGTKEIQTKQIYKNGVLVSQDVISEDVIKEPVNEVIAIGTKVIKKSSGSSSGNKSSGSVSAGDVQEVRTMTATAYSGDSSTATGTYPRTLDSGYATIAADPSVLPYGTMVYIEGFGYGRVEDTGGFVNWSGGSNTIDIFMGSEAACNAWGRQTVTVYILN